MVSLVTGITGLQGRLIGIMGINLPLARFAARLASVQRRLAAGSDVHIWIVNDRGQALASSERVPFSTDLRATLPGLVSALQGKQGSVTAREQNHEWLYSYVPVRGTYWAVILQRPADVTFAAILSFQNSLLIALVTLLVGATFFWFALHGWVVAPLGVNLRPPQATPCGWPAGRSHGLK